MLTRLQGGQGEGLTGPQIWCQATRGRRPVSSLELHLHLGTSWFHLGLRQSGVQAGDGGGCSCWQGALLFEGRGSKAVGTTGCGVRTAAPRALPARRWTDQLVDAW